MSLQYKLCIASEARSCYTRSIVQTEAYLEYALKNLEQIRTSISGLRLTRNALCVRFVFADVVDVAKRLDRLPIMWKLRSA